MRIELNKLRATAKMTGNTEDEEEIKPSVSALKKNEPAKPVPVVPAKIDPKAAVKPDPKAKPGDKNSKTAPV